MYFPTEYYSSIRNSKDLNQVLQALGLQGGSENDLRNYALGQDREFSTPVDLIVAGCSFTKAEGVPYELSWGYRLSGLLGVDNYVNISGTGWSTHEYITRMLNFMHEHGNPKYIAVLNTELYRAAMMLNVEDNSAGDYTPNSVGFSQLTLANRGGPSYKTVKYSKRPHDLSEVISLDMAAQQSLNSINALIRHCKQNNIKLAWGTWDRSSAEFFEYLASSKELSINYSETYVPLPHYQDKHLNRTVLPETCHLDLKQSNPDIFLAGSDNGLHSGSHYHAHWAEDLYSRLTS